MLEVRLKKSLPGFNLDVAFAIDRDLLSIIGPSGSGKTMTLLCIAGLMRPDEGRIELNGRLLFDSASGQNLHPRQRRVGFVFQNYALFPHMTVKENIAFGIRHLSRQEIDKRVMILLDKMSIQGFGQRYPRQLSAGQQQRVAVARALAPEPEILLMDEPFSALDAQVKERLGNELWALQRFYQGEVVFVTHDLAEGYKLSSKIAVYEAGRILQCDSKQAVIESPASHGAARLTGVKNLMAGVVAEIGDDDAWVTVPELGGRLRTALRNGMNLAVDQRVTVGVRPEYIQIAGRPGENTFPATVLQVMEGVTGFSYQFEVGGKATGRCCLEASLPKVDLHRIPDGRGCYLFLPPERMCLIRD